jgi:hypothetical protein
MKAYLSFVADVAGTYTILVSADDANTAYTAGDPSVIWTITTTGAPTSLTLTSMNATQAYTATTGARIKAVLKDANGAVTNLGANEALSLTSSDSNVVFTSNGSSAITALSSANFATLGYAIFYAEENGNNAAVTSAVITASGSGILSSSVNANITVSFKTPEAAVNAIGLIDTTGLAVTTSAATTPDGYSFTSADDFDTSESSHTFVIASTSSTTLTKYYLVTVTDNSGKITGVAGTTLDLVATQAATTAATAGYATVTIAATLLDEEYFTVAEGTDTSNIVRGETIVLGSWNQVTPDSRALAGATVTVKAQALDQYNNAIANAAVAVSVSGRNVVAATNKVSDADGYVSFTYTDTAASTSTLTADTVLFDGAATDADVVITYGAYTVGTVTVTGGATANTVAYPAVGSTTKAITTAVGGAAGSATTFTATVKDASGNLLSGVPVTWTVDKATAGITKTLTADSATCVTGSAGTCTTTVFSWAAPSKVTVTATAGTATGTGYENFVNAAADARVLSATVSGSLAVAKVVDRYGNAVAGVTVSAKTSNGYFGSGATSTTGVTTEEGTVGFALTGAGTVTLSVDSATYTQTDDLAGYVGATAVTASVAGTTTGVGASFSPAGVNSVAVEITDGTNSASQAAADAAAEATDAANAATDAANSAAEAADAATAAAQDAADAVAALATQVATYISNLRKQITALTNLVIKIQKKVNA